MPARRPPDRPRRPRHHHRPRRSLRINDDPTEPFDPHVLRHTFATQLIRDGKDPVLVAELLGHGSLDTTRRYALPTEADKAAALDALITDH
ncbi:tyrosine-type recombinase/integrase [Nonomuraea sp. NPDC050383]|uniref:tyrosine-type recombinase/integrase n=1 Tax=Nonomuraea sp. NPDC050383 TaxID=3364362 RepID=UPI0037AAECC2